MELSGLGRHAPREEVADVGEGEGRPPDGSWIGGEGMEVDIVEAFGEEVDDCLLDVGFLLSVTFFSSAWIGHDLRVRKSHR